MPVGTIYVPVGGDGEAPQSYTVPGAAILDLQAVTAYFDGGGAAVDWLPAVQIFDSSGHMMAQTVGETVPAGDGAQVTFAPFLNQPEIEAPTSAGVTVASMWFDHGVFADPFVSVPAGGPIQVPFANVYTPDASLMSFDSLVSANDALLLHSTEHFYLISFSSLWQLGGFVQQTLLQGNSISVVGGQLLGNISLHKIHPADYFNIVQPIAGSTQGQIDYMFVLPSSDPYTVQASAFHNSGTAKNLQAAFIAAVAFPLA